MFRWWFVGLVVGALITQITPAAFAGCEGGDTAGRHNAIAYCCDNGDRVDGHGKGGRSVTVSGLRAAK